MKQNMGKFLGVMICCLLIFTTGCGNKNLKNGEEVVAEVNGKKITADELYQELKTKYGRDVLIEMIDDNILNDMYPTDDETKEYVDQQISAMKQQTGEDKFLETVQYYYGVADEKELRAMLEMNYKRQKAVENYAKENVSDKEIKEYYEDNIFGDIEVSHILIKPETTDDMTDEQKAEAEEKAKKEAEDIIKKLDKGEDFAALAKKYSDDDATKKKGGSLGYINKGQMVTEFDDAAFGLEKGKYTTSPIKTEYGYHIIKKTNQKDKPKLDLVKEDIISKISEQKLNDDVKLQYEAIKKVREDKGLKIEDSTLKKAYNQYMSDLMKIETTDGSANTDGSTNTSN